MNRNKYRLGFLKKNKFVICPYDFVLTTNGLIGQYISSNWFKQEITLSETIYMFLIKYNSPLELEDIYGNIQESVYESQVLEYAQSSVYIISSYVLNGNQIEWNNYQIQHPQRITLHNIQNNIVNSTLSISLVKNREDRMFLYGPTFTITI